MGPENRFVKIVWQGITKIPERAGVKSPTEVKIGKNFQPFPRIGQEPAVLDYQLERRINLAGKGFVGFAQIYLARSFEPSIEDFLPSVKVETQFHFKKDELTRLLPWHLEIDLQTHECEQVPYCRVKFGYNQYTAIPIITGSSIFRYELFYQEEGRQGRLFFSNNSQDINDIEVQFNIITNETFQANQFWKKQKIKGL